MTDKNIIGLLLYKRLQGELTNQEKQQLEEWRLLSDDNRLLLEELENEETLADRLAEFYPDNKIALRDRILMKINEAAGKEQNTTRHIRNISFLYKWGWAAAAVLVLGLGVYLWNISKEKSARTVSAEAHNAKVDVQPGGNKAILTLSDGSTIILDSVANGTLALQGNSEIIKKDGQIIYGNKGASYPPPAGVSRSDGGGPTNTMTTPKGGQYQVTLPDGSRVWLNAASSITYPTAFTGNERKVSITGEAYFEVAHDASKPFYVAKGNVEVKVLGTHFNVNAYDDEHNIKVTLLEGAVRVSNGNGESILKPGQQAQVTNTVKVVSNVDIETVMAWKNGMFAFDGYEDINAIMRQISRWYNVEVEYKGKVTTLFGGSVSRSENVSQVLKMLEATGDVSFKLEDRKVIVIPAK